MLHRHFLRTSVPLPEGLTYEQIFSALEHVKNFFSLIQDETGINLPQIIQANIFSGIVSNVFTRMLSDVSDYKLFDDQRFPDLMHQVKHIGLEVKASNKPMKGGEGHNGHSGWHIVVCFQVMPDGSLEFTQVEIANLIGYECENSDWKYCGSSRNDNDSQRTETYVTTPVGTAKLRDGTVYLDSDFIQISKPMISARKKLSNELPIPDSSPFSQTDVRLE